MRHGRAPNELRPITLHTGVNRWAEGSAQIDWGHTRVVATVTIEDRLPPHLRGPGVHEGWLTAEYALLPRSTRIRRPREVRQVSGRSQEIRRLIGRALRSAVDLSTVPKRTLIVDVDVLQADGGTRCAGIVAGFAALRDWADRATRDGRLDEYPLRCSVAAVGVGLVGDEVWTDLDEGEDAKASVDLSIVATSDGGIVEVHGGTEDRPIDAERYVSMVGRGVAAVETILRALEPDLP